MKKKVLVVLGFVIVALASPSLWAAQFARPDGTLSASGWSAVNAATLHDAINETVADDANYIDTGIGNSSTVIFSLSNVSDPGSYANNHIIRWRCQATVGSKPKGGETCDAALYQGNTLIDGSNNNSATRGAFGLMTYTILDASAITDYSALELRITSGMDVDESIQVSWAELEVPGASATPPTVTTPTFASVTDTTATLGGNVTDNGGASVTARGVEWGTSPGSYPNSVPEGGGGTGVFTVPVTGLPSSTTIYFRAWATNAGGTGYTAESSFTTTAPASPPTVDTPTYTSVTENTAVLGGTVSDNGGSIISDRGIVWNTSSPAESGGTIVSMGSGLGTFSQTVSSLPAGTLIYFKAYATNSAGTSYSTESSFTTQVGLATVDSPTVANIQATSADLGGTVSSDGGGTVSDRGIVWNTTTPPESGGTSVSMGSGLGTFSQTVSGLPNGTVVYYRAYATNESGTAYSSISTFTPSGPPVVTSPTVANITHNSADLGGTVTDDGGNLILQRGTVWNTTGAPEVGVDNVDVEGGTTIGTFSHTVSLPANTTIYYRAYATSSVGTGYSPEDSFVTASEPTIQASNINFTRVAGGGLTVSWTRGNGDGSIVVLRLSSTLRTDPQDGDDYTGNPDFTLAPELPTNSQNHVIYKGESSYLMFNGLAQNTSYTVAIYEYAGSGVDTDYLQLNPAEASQTTTNFAIHNQDFNVSCSDCHNAHNQWLARGTELKGICETCHNPLGRASAKLEFDNHLLPNKNPGIDNVDCGMCHELHNFGGGNTTLALNAITSLTDYNKSFLRANVNKYVPNATTPAFLHNDQPKRDETHPDGPIAANTPERAVEGGDDTTSRGYCQNCHTLTKYHTNNPSVSTSDQCHDGETGNCGPAETHCGECHQHNNKFIGVGGTQTCIECHSSAQGTRPIITTQFDRASTHIPGGSATVTQEDCLVCHNQGGHQGGAVSTWDADDGATTYTQPTTNAPTTAAGEGEAFAAHCLSCHDDGVAGSLSASGSDQTQTSPFTGSGAPPIIDEAGWATAGHNRDYATFPSSPVSCIGDGATGCHGSGHGSENVALLAPVGGPSQSLTVFCYECHDADGPSSYNILTQFDNGTNYQTTSNSGALVNQRHDITAADQAYSGGAVSCADCHSPHTDNAANPVSDPDDGSALPTYSPSNSYTDDGHNFTYNPGGNSNPNAPEGGGSVTEPDFINFCLTCHDGTAPPGVTMPVDLVNMAVAWNSDQHGTGEGSSGTRFGKGSLKYPYTDGSGTSDPANPYAAMNCNTCHGAHGSGNIFNLRESVSVAGVQMQVGGNPGSEFDTFSGTTYYLPTNGDGTQDDHQWGAWCTFCHDMSAHAGVDETVTCTSGHMHGANNF